MKIALIAHDKKKDEIIELAKQYKDVLANYELYATGTTGTLIMGETALPIHRMKSGPLGGDQQIGAMLANGELGLIIFLRDPLTAQPHEPDVSALLRLCDVQKIPLATNASSAIIMLESLQNGTFAKKRIIVTNRKGERLLSKPFALIFQVFYTDNREWTLCECFPLFSEAFPALCHPYSCKCFFLRKAFDFQSQYPTI